MILTMITTGLAVRTGRVFSNLRVDLDASNTKWSERQIAIVMEAGGCTRSTAKAALESCNHNCKTAVLMVLTGWMPGRRMNCWRRITALFVWHCRKLRNISLLNKKKARDAGFYHSGKLDWYVIPTPTMSSVEMPFAS